MADQMPGVNRPFAAARVGSDSMKKSAGPVHEGAELVWIGHEINNERYGCQHEYQVSHGIFPALKS